MTEKKCIEWAGEVCGIKAGAQISSCPNDMTGLISPILIGEKPLGSVIVGGFFSEAKPPDRNLFVERAKAFGFNEQEYLHALDRVPIIREGKIDAALKLSRALAGFISSMACSQEELRAERERFKLSMDTAEALIVCLDASAGITMINRYGLKLLGFEKESELLGKNWFEIALPQPEGMERVYPVFMRLMKGELEGASYFENRIITSSGEMRLIAWRNAFLKDVMGRPTGTLSVGLDITEARAAQQEKQKLMERLLESRKLEGLGRLAGGAAHRYNNLLGVILGGAEMALMSQGIDDDLRETLNMIRRAATKSAEITAQLLAFAKKQS